MSSDARARAAEALRRFGHALHTHEPDEELFERVARAAQAVTAEVERAAPRQRDLRMLKRRLWADPIAEGDEIDHFDDCFVSGRFNPLGIGVHVVREADEAVARVTLGPAFEGAPGRSHGGIVAAIFDDVLGCVLRLERVPAFTGELRVRYLAPTPIGEELTFRARTAARDGRKLDIEGEAYVDHGGSAPEMVARSSGRFIIIESFAPDGDGD